MSRVHVASKRRSIPSESVDSWKHENRPGLGCEDLLSSRALRYCLKLFRNRTISWVGRATGNPVAKARPQLKPAVTLSISIPHGPRLFVCQAPNAFICVSPNAQNMCVTKCVHMCVTNSQRSSLRSLTFARFARTFFNSLNWNSCLKSILSKH